MTENLEKPSRPTQFRTSLQTTLSYLKQVFLAAAGVAMIVGVSFIFTNDFTARAYSDRLFIVGVFLTMLGVFVFVTIAGTRRNMGLPTLARTKEDAQKIFSHTDELRAKAEKRYDAGSQVWIIGAACMVLSILLYYILSIFKY